MGEAMSENSTSHFDLARLVDVTAGAWVNCIITGETGTGKRSLAEMIHSKSGAKGPFTVFDASIGDDQSSASELDKTLESAGNGTVYLKEPGKLDREAQNRPAASPSGSESKAWGGIRKQRSPHHRRNQRFR